MRLGSLLVALAFVACSSESSSSSAPAAKTCETAATPAAFGAYCTVQSTVDLKLLRAAPPMGWFSQDDPCVAKGSTVYVASNGEGSLDGYVFLDGGTVPAKLQPGRFDDPLVAGTHYTGSCPVPATEPPNVLLADMNVFASGDMSGAACKMTAGTELPDFAFSNQDANVVSVTSPAVMTACSFDRGFTKDLTVAPLVKK